MRHVDLDEGVVAEVRGALIGAQQQVAHNSETLLKFEIPMAAEPAFQFKA